LRWQRYLTAANLKEARKALWLKLAFTMPVLLIFAHDGPGPVRILHVKGDRSLRGTKRMDQILPYFVANRIALGIPGLLIAAIYGATWGRFVGD